jgi:hypothetical protein
MATTQQVSTSARRLAVLVLAALAAGTNSAQAPATPPQQPSSSCKPARTQLASSPADAASTRAVAAVRPARSSRHSYSWPLKPFERQHPVRAFFDDPRIHEGATHAFHFGIDISAPDFTKVYAVEAGKVHLESGMAVSVVAPDGSHTFGYWHILPLVRNHQLVKRHQLLGVVGPGWEHVHFAESWHRRYVNPLRPGALGPYADRMPPTVAGVGIVRAGSGVLTVVADAFDTPQPRVPGAWADEPVTPALLQWRVVRTGANTGGWHSAADFRVEMLGQDRFHDVYAPGTEQNHKGEPGRFCFYLTKRWQPTLADGRYALQVRATDTRGNWARLDLALTVESGTIA